MACSSASRPTASRSRSCTGSPTACCCRFGVRRAVRRAAGRGDRLSRPAPARRLLLAAHARVHGAHLLHRVPLDLRSPAARTACPACAAWPLLGLDLDDQRVFYYFCAVIVFVTAWLVWRVVHAPLGTVLVAIRENEQRARFAGYPVLRYKLAAFVISDHRGGSGRQPVRLSQAVRLGRSGARELLRRDAGDDRRRRHGQLPRSGAGRRCSTCMFREVVTSYTASLAVLVRAAVHGHHPVLAARTGGAGRARARAAAPASRSAPPRWPRA